jgi:hypothetical protein
MPRIPNTTNRQSAFLRALSKNPTGLPKDQWPSPAILRRWLRKPGFRAAFETLRATLAAQTALLRSHLASRRLLVNLPTRMEPLIGRDDEVTVLRGLRRRDEVRLLALTGPGGIGKTRLALQVAAYLADDFADGVVVVPLETLRQAQRVMTTIARTLGVRESGSRSLAASRHAFLRPLHLLLVLDNFEQVLAAASQVGAMLAACPRQPQVARLQGCRARSASRRQRAAFRRGPRRAVPRARARFPSAWG